MITDDELRQVMPQLPAGKRALYLPFLQKAMEEFGINSYLRKAAFLGQLAHESGQLKFMEEIWGPTSFQRNYEPPSDTARRLGNTQPGDGKRYKGRGPIQLTGRDNYGRFGGLLGEDLVGNPERAATPEVGFRIAGLYWKSRGLNELADQPDYREITVRINGRRCLGWEDRVKYYEKAKAVNLPADTVKRNIDKATGNLEGVNYEEIRYEGYGIGGAAVIVDTMTDNRVRTVAEVRHAFSKHGGNMGTDGSVAFQFKQCGQFVFAPGTSEDKVMEVALDAGADDVIAGDDGAIEVLTVPADFEAVQQALHKAGLKPDLAEVTWRAENPVELAGDDSQRMQKLLDVLEDLDDAQAVYHNAVLE